MTGSWQLPATVEPLFQELGASVHLTPVMNAEASSAGSRKQACKAGFTKEARQPVSELTGTSRSALDGSCLIWRAEGGRARDGTHRNRWLPNERAAGILDV
jgi:hypothetical protein